MITTVDSAVLEFRWVCAIFETWQCKCPRLLFAKNAFKIDQTSPQQKIPFYSKEKEDEPKRVSLSQKQNAPQSSSGITSWASSQQQQQQQQLQPSSQNANDQETPGERGDGSAKRQPEFWRRVGFRTNSIYRRCWKLWEGGKTGTLQRWNKLTRDLIRPSLVSCQFHIGNCPSFLSVPFL